jgi:release factor glutamine methyltransferase
MTVEGALAAAASRLERAGVPQARLNAELLLADLLGTDRGGLLVSRRDSLDRDLSRRYVERVRRRELREPLQHITGFQEFYGLAFRVDRRVLVPRPETEGLIEAALARDLPRDARVADVGTGSGCLAVSLAVARTGYRLHAMDSSPEALEVARANASLHGVEDRIEFRIAEMAEVPHKWRGMMDLVVSNPPYISEKDWVALEPEVREHDPREALVAGPSGLEGYRELLPAARALLRPEGCIIVELGYGQAEEVGGMARAEGFRPVGIDEDFQGIPRVLIAVLGRS